MANLDSVLITLNTKLNIESNAAIHSSQFDSVGRNGHLLAAPPTVNTAIQILFFLLGKIGVLHWKLKFKNIPW